MWGRDEGPLAGVAGNVVQSEEMAVFIAGEFHRGDEDVAMVQDRSKDEGVQKERRGEPAVGARARMWGEGGHAAMM